MILTPELITQIYNDNPNKESIKYKQNKSKLLKAHITGIGAKDYIENIEDYERRKVTALRKKMMMSNIDIVHRVLLPRKKIYTAKGGVEIYNLKKPDQVNEFKEYIANITGQQSLKTYIRDILQKRVDYDPEGLSWVEVNEDGIPYPAFKSIQSIYEWQLNGRELDYVFFDLSPVEIKQYILQGVLRAECQKLKVYRVVDDKSDRLVTFKSGTIIEYEVPNPFGFVPGRILSNISGEEGKDDANSYSCYQSPLHPIVELLNKFMFQRSVFDIAFARTAYPKEWMNKFTCPTCNGKKKYDGNDCPECFGTGVLPLLKNMDVAVVEYSNETNKGVPNPPMGTVEAPVEGLQFMKDNNLTLEEMVYYTLYGTYNPSPGTSNKIGGKSSGKGGNVSNTAFEASLNDQSKRDVLRDWGTWVSDTTKWYVDITGKFIYGDSYISSAILTGDKYLEESSDATFDRLDKARIGKAPKSQLNSLQIEYLDNKYQNNPLEWRKYYVLFIAEPFMWDTTADVITWDIPLSDKLKKIYFDEWVCSLTDDYFAGLPDDGLEQQVKADLEKFMLDRYQKGVQTDNLLFTSMGNSLNVGDNVTVSREKALMPEHAGKKFTIKQVNAKYVTLVDENKNTVNGYSRDDIQKTSGVRGGMEYGIN